MVCYIYINMADIICVDSSDDEEISGPTLTSRFPVIAKVESFGIPRRNCAKKRVVARKIGDCILSPIKRHKTNNSCIEISDDSDVDNDCVPQSAVNGQGRPFSSNNKQESIEIPIISLIDDSPNVNECLDISVSTPKHNNIIKCLSDQKSHDNVLNLVKDEHLHTTSSESNQNVTLKEPHSIGNNHKNDEKFVCNNVNSTVEVVVLSNTGNSTLEHPMNANLSAQALERFLKECEVVDASEDMKKVISKIHRYYNLAHDGYKNSESCISLIKRTTTLVQSKQNYFWHIKDLLDELRIRRNHYAECNDPGVSSNRDFEDITEATDAVKQRRINRLERAMRKINKVLKRLEEQEVDFEEDSRSTYLLQDRYERRLIKIYNKLCEITGEKPCAGRAIKRKFSVVAGAYPSINKSVQDLVNKKNIFPDYHDILNLIKTCNVENNLQMSPTAIGQEARRVFEKVGTELQRRRQADYYLSISDYLQAEVDPATQDSELRARLVKNQKESEQRISDVINKYVEKAEKLDLKEEVVKSDEETNTDDERASSDEAKSHADSDDESKSDRGHLDDLESDECIEDVESKNGLSEDQSSDKESNSEKKELNNKTLDVNTLASIKRTDLTNKEVKVVLKKTSTETLPSKLS